MICSQSGGQAAGPTNLCVYLEVEQHQRGELGIEDVDVVHRALDVLELWKSFDHVLSHEEMPKSDTSGERRLTYGEFLQVPLVSSENLPRNWERNSAEFPVTRDRWYLLSVRMLQIFSALKRVTCRYSSPGVSNQSLVIMADSDIENLPSGFAASGVTVPSASDMKSTLARQDRPPLVPNASNYSHRGSHVPDSTATETSNNMTTTSTEEQFRSLQHEKVWALQSKGGERVFHRFGSKHFGDSTEKDFPHRRSSVGEIVSSEFKTETEDGGITEEVSADRYLSGGFEMCQLPGEIIDIDREAGFGEDEDFGGEEDLADCKLDDNTEGRPHDDEELTPHERYKHPRFSRDEDCATDCAGLQLSLGVGDADQWEKISTETANPEDEGNSEDTGDKTPADENSADSEWLSLRSSHEDEHLSGRRDFWEERLKVQFEEETLPWKEKRRRKDHPFLHGALTSGNLSLRKNSEHIDHVVRDMITELRLGDDVVRPELGDIATHGPSIFLPETQSTSYKLMVMAFEELLREVEVTGNKNKKELEDVFRAKEEEAESMQRERRTWFEREEELRGRIDSLETQCSRTSDMLSETTRALKVEKERRTDSRRELERLTEELVTEKKLHRETAEKLNSYVTYFAKLENVLATVKSAAKDRDLMSLECLESIINDMNIEFHFNFTHSSEKKMQSDSEYLSSELHRIIMQRDAADAERDMIEERLSTILRETREGHGEMEALWFEREKLLEQKIGCLEAELHHLHCRSKRKETEVMIERRRWADELEKKAVDGPEVTDCAKISVVDEVKLRKEGRKEVTNSASATEPMHDAGCRIGSDDRMYIKVGNLISSMEEVVDNECEDEKIMVQRRKTEEWKRLAEQDKQEMKETEKKLSAALDLVSKLEEDRKEMEGLLAEKSVEVEKLRDCLKSKERDLDVTIQKFTDELKLIDKEVERERKEREQVMELHFASKRQLVSDMKAKEESWEKALEVRNHELQMIADQLKTKQKDVEELQRRTDEEKTLRERTELQLENQKTIMRKEMEEMLADIWRVCEEQKIEAAVGKELLPGGDLSLRRPMWESLWLEYCRSKEVSDNATVSASVLEWEFARGNMGQIEKQVTEAMASIKSLRDEVKAKEEQLLKVKADREREWEKREEVWAHEREKLLDLIKSFQRKELQLNEERQRSEQELTKKMEAFEELRKTESEEAGAIISSLRKTAKELEWCLKRTNDLSLRRLKLPGPSGALRDNIFRMPDENNELVQVHTSYSKQLDRYIFDLENRREPAERDSILLDRKLEAEADESAKERDGWINNVEQAANEFHTTPGSGGDFSLILGIDDERHLSPQVSRERNLSSRASGSRRSLRRVVAPLERGMCLTLNGMHTFTKESSGSEEAEGNLAIWQPESHKSWMSDEMQSYPNSPTRGYRTAPPTPTRRSQKWLVDASWLEQVRKEHASLRQQLENERQRVSALARVEAENRWIEAAIGRALELKRESDTKAAEMQRKLNAMETWLSTKKMGRNKS
ncbi:hypothetical protein R1flu_005192 [Riccia fluitans]|uniref:Uncharacterized protein n=1 Tax=Riccia fluitans TaxID=41844 RepID=A0ABD1YT23_9MARC